MTDAPTNIRALQSDQVLELTWGDGVSVRLRYHLLRGECPCASCRDEWTGARILDPSTLPPDLNLVGMEGVGSYAIRLTWNDGHGSGLYTWEHLRKLCDGAPALSDTP